MPSRIADHICAIVIRLIDRGHSVAEAAELTGLSEHTVRTIRNEWDSPSSTVRRPLGILGRPRALNLGDIWFLTEQVHQTPGLYLSEIQGELSNVCSVDVSLGTISNIIKRCGITRKKVEKHAKERSEPRRIEHWQQIHALYTPEQLVPVDESSIDLRSTERPYGYSILPPMLLDGILALRVIEGSFTAESFWDFIKHLLTKMNPYPGPKSVIVVDNARIHQSAETLEMIEARGMQFLFLPAYSPDCNPIKFAFSKIKSSIRRDGEMMRMMMVAAQAAEFRPQGDPDYVDPDVLTRIYQYVYSVTAEDAWGWFKHCNYNV
ncbi:DDE superfamily endonuclease, partial [Rhizoctonia solani]